MKMIITADWHIRASKPRCRIESDSDWIETQKQALNQVVNIAKDKNAVLVVVGDIFHSNSDTNFECIQLIQNIAERMKIYVLAGNHDLPYHNSNNISQSAIGVLLKSNNIYLIKELNADFSASNFDEEDNINAEIVFKHVLTMPESEGAIFNCETPESLLRQFKNAKWIFTGDYHRNFHFEKDNRHVINSGCLLRQTSDMNDYQCGVYYVDTDVNDVEFIPIIDDKPLIDDSNIISDCANDSVINFVNELKNTKHVSLDFRYNVEKAIIENKIDSELKETIFNLLNERG